MFPSTAYILIKCGTAERSRMMWMRCREHVGRMRLRSVDLTEAPNHFNIEKTFSGYKSVNKE